MMWMVKIVRTEILNNCLLPLKNPRQKKKNWRARESVFNINYLMVPLLPLLDIYFPLSYLVHLQCTKISFTVLNHG